LILFKGKHCKTVRHLFTTADTVQELKNGKKELFFPSNLSFLTYIIDWWETAVSALKSQNIQSTSLSLQSSELAPPRPLSRKRVLGHPLWFQGGAHSRFREREEPIWTKGQTIWHSRYSIIPLRFKFRLYFVPVSKKTKKLKKLWVGCMDQISIKTPNPKCRV
jgi:hypothetical protein